MRRCPYCNVGIEGDLVKCPLCQSKLPGTGEESCYPKFEAQKKQSLYYKMQLAIVWGLLIVGAGLDFLVRLRLPSFPDLHWSLLSAMWLIGFEFGIMRQFKPGTGSAGKVTMMVLITIVMWCVTAYFFGLMKITLGLVVPVVHGEFCACSDRQKRKHNGIPYHLSVHGNHSEHHLLFCE